MPCLATLFATGPFTVALLGMQTKGIVVAGEEDEEEEEELPMLPKISAMRMMPRSLASTCVGTASDDDELYTSPSMELGAAKDALKFAPELQVRHVMVVPKNKVRTQ